MISEWWFQNDVELNKLSQLIWGTAPALKGGLRETTKVGQDIRFSGDDWIRELPNTMNEWQQLDRSIRQLRPSE
jgi:hypothetical protein